MIEVNEQLAYIKHFLKKEKPSISDVVECYLTAADLYLQLEDADKVIECLVAAEKPVFSYNNGVLFGEYTPQQLDPNSILNEMNANLYRYEQLSVEQLEAMRKSGTYITPTEESKSDSGEYKLTDETFDISAEDSEILVLSITLSLLVFSVYIHSVLNGNNYAFAVKKGVHQ